MSFNSSLVIVKTDLLVPYVPLCLFQAYSNPLPAILDEPLRIFMRDTTTPLPTLYAFCEIYLYL